MSDRVLVYVARKLGPALDQVEAKRERLSVLDVVKEFSGQMDGPTPTEVRAALMDQVDRGHLARVPFGCGDDPELVEGCMTVALRVRGLVAARRFDPQCGRPERTLKLVFNAKSHFLHARFEAGNKDLDARLNKSGMALAAFYLVAALEPNKERPLVVADCAPMIQRLAAHKVGPKTGPGTRLAPADEAVRSALDLVREILPLQRAFFEDDKRRDYYFLDGTMPEILVVRGSRLQFSSWTELRRAVWCVVINQGFLAPNGDAVQPLAGEAKPAAAAAAADASVG